MAREKIVPAASRAAIPRAFAVASESSTYPFGNSSNPQSIRRSNHVALGPSTGSQYHSTYSERAEKPWSMVVSSCQGMTVGLKGVGCMPWCVRWRVGMAHCSLHVE